MTKALADTAFMTVRHVMALWRQPVWIFVTLVQPVIWLLLFGALFGEVTEIPGFTSNDYIQFLAPGVVVMTAFFSAGWSGMGILEDYNRGVLDRFLVSPAKRSSLITGALVQNSINIVIQSLIIIVLALIVGASFDGGVGGVLVTCLVAVLVGAGFGALSNGMALITRKEETLIALMQFFLLPLSFLSTTFMQKDLMPDWMQSVAAVNPVNWAVEASRSALGAAPDWGEIALYCGLLAAFLVLGLALAVRGFRAYQRSI